MDYTHRRIRNIPQKPGSSDAPHLIFKCVCVRLINSYGLNMKMKLAITAMISLSIGVATGAYATRDFMAKMMLQGLYVSNAAQANAYLTLLKIQSEGDQAKLVKTLENLLNIQLITLNGCYHDFCKNKEIPEVKSTINKINQYELKYIKP